jgi:diguanylate cyclase (GGDEF)-like protein/PAS domain S-box-containing protein
MTRKSHPQSEPNIREGEETFGLLFANHPIPMWIYDLKTLAFLEVNDAMAEQYGYTREEFLGLTLRDIHPPEEAARLLDEMKQPRPPLRHAGEWRHCLKDGRIIQVEITSHTLKFAGRNSALVMALDITARKQAERTLHESEEQYYSLFDRIMDGIYRSTHAGRFVDVNPALVRMFGFASREEMLAVDIKNELYFEPEERGSHILDTGQEQTEVYRMRRKDGSEIWVEDHGYYVHDELGNIIYHEGMLRDFTERKQALDALADSEAELRALFNSMRDVVLVIDRKGVYRKIAPTNPDLLYRPAQELLGRNLRDVFPPGQVNAFISVIEQVLKTRKTAQIGYDLQIDGRQVWFETSISPTDEDCTIWVARDVTQRKQVEDELRRANKSLKAAHRELQQLFAHEQALARTDGLTGLYNRRYFFELATREFNGTIRYRRPLTIILFDVDDFKQANDSFGHAMGDTILAQIAQAAAAQVRDVDVLARYGGDEFIILLPQTGAQQAFLIAERIRESVASTRVETDNSPFMVTLSIGVAEMVHTPQDRSVEDAIRRADQALYAAKQSGHNRTVIFQRTEAD